MAANQMIHMNPGLTSVVARIEKLSEPGSPRQYWDGAGKAWSADPASHVPVIPDPDLPGAYLIQVPTSETSAWPDGGYRVTGLNSDTTTPDKIAFDPFTMWMLAGDDGGNGVPCVTLPWLGGTITLWGARFNVPTPRVGTA